MKTEDSQRDTQKKGESKIYNYQFQTTRKSEPANIKNNNTQFKKASNSFFRSSDSKRSNQNFQGFHNVYLGN